MEQLIQAITSSFDLSYTTNLIIRFIVNGVFALLVIDKIYYRTYRQKEYLFTFAITNLLIFFVTSLLATVKIKTGFAFGMFAIFSILRFRTEQMQIKEMSFLFISVILAVINSLATQSVPFEALLIANSVIVGGAWLLEKQFVRKPIRHMVIQYENIDLIPLSRREELIRDLQKRTDLQVIDVEVGRINYLQDSAELTVAYE